MTKGHSGNNNRASQTKKLGAFQGMADAVQEEEQHAEQSEPAPTSYLRKGGRFPVSSNRSKAYEDFGYISKYTNM